MLGGGGWGVGRGLGPVPSVAGVCIKILERGYILIQEHSQIQG